MKFGDRLKRLRESKKLTQRELANILKMGYSTLAMYETNKREPDFSTIGLIADFFNVSTDYLLGRVKTNDLPSDDYAAVKTYSIKFIKELFLQNMELVTSAFNQESRRRKSSLTLSNNQLEEILTSYFDNFDDLSKEEQVEFFNNFNIKVKMNDEILSVHFPVKLPTSEDSELLEKLKSLSPEKRKAIEILASDNEQSAAVDK